MQIYSVSEITREIRLLIEERFGEVVIEGEISNFKPAGSGHFYFNLKDDQSQIRAVMFRGANLKLKFRAEQGLAVRCYGRLSLYEPRGEYQIIVEQMELKGVGALQLAFEQLKKKLEAEGLFAAERKRPLPFLPKKIGIITSPTGAVIRDMINVLTRRFPNVHIILSPVLVQGTEAAAQIAEAIREMNEREDIDLLIVGRGGGSIEDLWAFNEEVVARAIVASRIVVISAVGHETDFTIADFVADVRAPTPSVAAELAVPVMADLLMTIDSHRERLVQCMEQKLENARLQVRQWKAYFRDPGRRVIEFSFKIQHYREQLAHLVHNKLQRISDEKKRLQSLLESLSPLAVLERGYSITLRQGDSTPLKQSNTTHEGDALEIRLHEGKIKARVV